MSDFDEDFDDIVRDVTGTGFNSDEPHMLPQSQIFEGCADVSTALTHIHMYLLELSETITNAMNINGDALEGDEDLLVPAFSIKALTAMLDMFTAAKTFCEAIEPDDEEEDEPGS